MSSRTSPVCSATNDAVDVGQAGEHLVGTEDVERGQLREDADGDVHAAIMGLFSLWLQ